MDIWQANAEGRYDNDDPDKPPKKDVFLNRARMIADEAGYYEFETVHPGAYKIGPDAWRPSHIHYWISHPGYAPLVTQLFFKGDPHNKTDAFIKESLIIELETRKVGMAKLEVGQFDIVLAPAQTALTRPGVPFSSGASPWQPLTSWSSRTKRRSAAASRTPCGHRATP